MVIHTHFLLITGVLFYPNYDIPPVQIKHQSLLADAVITNTFLSTVVCPVRTQALLFWFLFCTISINPLIKGHVSSNKNNMVTVSSSN